MKNKTRGIYIPNQIKFQDSLNLIFDPKHIREMNILDKRQKEYALRNGKK